ncbi:MULTISPECIES: diguanylate cyclase [Novosphingobium]|jgi:diguanylate cyclase (GGDEF)-like protein|uniref:diguanylate cyclase n=1 Tax=Novosphingobium TaxID=165696 RepID=UPI0022F26A08|nr:MULTISPECIES: diguanylate cyclase [Novosphingobium]GLK44668.1 diguanylate cyclase response regulator [Novosphingobium resinovorum]
MSRGTILIVDDEVSNIEIMNAVLEDDYEVLFSTSGQQALDTARRSPPDLILLDVLMPGIDGFEVCRQIKADPELADIPVIFTTGLGDTDHEMRGLSLGAIDYVTKPIQPAILRARVGNHVELKRLRDQLANLAVTDALTGLSNRRQMEQALQAEVGRLGRTGDWLTVIMIDIDFFKQFNDTYGHPAGDRCIVMVSAALTRAVKRASDLPARYGGEEFACILPGADPEGAALVAQEISLHVQSLNIPHERSQVSPFITVSIGVASARCLPDMTPEMWLKEADQQLYRSKQQGRDRVTAIEFGAIPANLQG